MKTEAQWKNGKPLNQNLGIFKSSLKKKSNQSTNNHIKSKQKKVMN